MNRKPSLINSMYYHIDELKSSKLDYTDDNHDDDSTNADKEICEFIVKTVKVRVIKYAYLSNLIKALTISYNENFERNFLEIFFTTYRTFSNTTEIMELIFNHYTYLHDKIELEIKNYNRNPEAIDVIKILDKKKRNLLFALETWLDDYPEDWSEINLRKLINFLVIFLPNSEIYIKVLSYLANYLNDQLEMQTISCKSNKRNKLISFKLNNIQPKHFAEQLTILDVELFLNLIPHECLGGIWSKRKEKKLAKTVAATVDQFNAVTLRVISTILMQTEMQERARTIETWIDIGQELKELKNFSSLKAIVSALQSNSIYRLSKTWAALAPKKIEIFAELPKTLVGENTKKVLNELNELQELNELNELNEVDSTNDQCGFIPYLGLFLTDLIMLDSALPDHIDENLINFDKKRKEYDIIDEIKNLQNGIKCATNFNHIKKDDNFNLWFLTLKTYPDIKSYDISCKLEPSRTNGLLARQKKLHNSEENDAEQEIRNKKKMNVGKRNSFYVIRVTYEWPNENKNENNNCNDSNSGNNNNSNTNCDNKTNNDTISGESPNVQYKSIMLGNNERTEHVIQHAVIKLGLKGKPYDYTLSQLLPDKELIIPRNANVYYAMNTLHNLNFIIRLKK